MSDSRESSPDTIDIEIDPVSLETNTASRNVRQRRSPSSDHYHIGEPSHAAGHSDSSSEPSEDEEEPSEDEETVPLSVHLRSPSPILSSSPPSPLPPASPLSPLPPVSPPTPVAPPSSLPSTVPTAPIAPSPPVLPSLSFNTRNQGVTLRWDWMPVILGAWRDAEQLPVIPMPYGLQTPTLPLTGEAIHHTIPVVVARLRTHDEQLDDIERTLQGPLPGVETLQQQVAGLDSELTEWRDVVVDAHTRGVEARQEIVALRQETVALRQETVDLRQELSTLRQELADIRAEREQPRANAPSS